MRFVAGTREIDGEVIYEVWNIEENRWTGIQSRSMAQCVDDADYMNEFDRGEDDDELV